MNVNSGGDECRPSDLGFKQHFEKVLNPHEVTNFDVDTNVTIPVLTMQ